MKFYFKNSISENISNKNRELVTLQRFFHADWLKQVGRIGQNCQKLLALPIHEPFPFLIGDFGAMQGRTQEFGSGDSSKCRNGAMFGSRG